MGWAALRAEALARCGQFGQALLLLLEVTNAWPEVPYLPWALVWLRESTAEDVDAEAIAANAVSALRCLQAHAHAAGARRNLEALEGVARSLAQGGAAQRSRRVRSCSRAAAPRTSERALAASLAWFEERPSWLSAAEVANTYGLGPEPKRLGRVVCRHRALLAGQDRTRGAAGSGGAARRAVVRPFKAGDSKAVIDGGGITLKTSGMIMIGASKIQLTKNVNDA